MESGVRKPTVLPPRATVKSNWLPSVSMLEAIHPASWVSLLRNASARLPERAREGGGGDALGYGRYWVRRPSACPPLHFERPRQHTDEVSGISHTAPSTLAVGLPRPGNYRALANLTSVPMIWWNWASRSGSIADM